MAKNSYEFQYDDYGNTQAILVYNRGIGVLHNSYVSKGTAFSGEERLQLGLEGLLPPASRSLAQQVANSVAMVNGKGSDIEKFVYLRSLFDRNVTLAHAVIAHDIGRFMRIVYTPVVAYACQHYSSMFRQANGLHLYPGNIHLAEEILRRYGHRDIRVAVVTDNQGILGIGDQGAGGIAICLGKLMLYTQGAGIAPWHCLPISLDVGTNNRELLADEEYLGWRHPRLSGAEYLDFLQRFARAFRAVYPNALCQWEDFSKQNAFAIRDSYLHDLISFNDDIQGTGAVALAGIMAAMEIKKESLGEQVYLIYGAGAGGVGIAEQIELGLLAAGLTVKEARARIYLLDSRGLVTSDRRLEPYKEKFAKDPGLLAVGAEGGTGALLATVKNGRVTVLIGTSGQGGAFTQEVVEALLVNSRRPVILPLSNPTVMAEATPEELCRWSRGQALLATGSPFPPLCEKGETIRIGQCNNVFAFPGVGLGILASGAREVRPSFFTAAAQAICAEVTAAELAAGALFPPVERLREVSSRVALAVGKAAISEGVSRACAFSTFQHERDEERLQTLIARMCWSPEYLPLLPAVNNRG